jgi:hypothetical protein
LLAKLVPTFADRGCHVVGTWVINLLFLGFCIWNLICDFDRTKSFNFSLPFHVSFTSFPKQWFAETFVITNFYDEMVAKNIFHALFH